MEQQEDDDVGEDDDKEGAALALLGALAGPLFAALPRAPFGGLGPEGDRNRAPAASHWEGARRQSAPLRALQPSPEVAEPPLQADGGTQAPKIGKPQKTLYTSRFVRVILAQGPC